MPSVLRLRSIPNDTLGGVSGRSVTLQLVSGGATGQITTVGIPFDRATVVADTRVPASYCPFSFTLSSLENAAVSGGSVRLVLRRNGLDVASTDVSGSTPTDYPFSPVAFSVGDRLEVVTTILSGTPVNLSGTYLGVRTGTVPTPVPDPLTISSTTLYGTLTDTSGNAQFVLASNSTGTEAGRIPLGATGRQLLVAGASVLVTAATDVRFTGTLTSSTGTGVFQTTRYGRAAAPNVVAGSGPNTVIGEEAGGVLTTGQHNTLIGLQAGALLTTGTDNTVIGSQAQVGATASACVSIGRQHSVGSVAKAVCLGSNNLVSHDDCVAIGTLAQTTKTGQLITGRFTTAWTLQALTTVQDRPVAEIQRSLIATTDASYTGRQSLGSYAMLAGVPTFEEGVRIDALSTGIARVVQSVPATPPAAVDVPNSTVSFSTDANGDLVVTLKASDGTLRRGTVTLTVV